jgi:hypothetical protein
MAEHSRLCLYAFAGSVRENQERRQNNESNSQAIAVMEELIAIIRELRKEVADLRWAVMELNREVETKNRPRLVGVTEACRMLGISHRTMMSRLKNGVYPFARMDNGTWKFPVHELERLVF